MDVLQPDVSHLGVLDTEEFQIFQGFQVNHPGIGERAAVDQPETLQFRQPGDVPKPRTYDWVLAQIQCLQFRQFVEKMQMLIANACPT